ncbi:MAG: hypothetical protein M1820_007576 [Bogoriella megaspora]|nr:MAG: hypothetical protein M1820_007576 [Bogoriella megaspora]
MASSIPQPGVSRTASPEAVALRQDSMDSLDQSPSRKRPRLDSGSSGSRIMSVDPRFSPSRQLGVEDAPSVREDDAIQKPTKHTTGISDDEHPSDSGLQSQTSHCPSQVRVPIRSPQKETMPRDISSSPPLLSTTSTLTELASECSISTPPDNREVNAANTSLSDNVSGKLESTQRVQGSSASLAKKIVAELYESLPTFDYEDYLEALSAITNHFSRSIPLDYSVVQDITRWLSQHLERTKEVPHVWLAVYMETRQIWLEVAVALHHLLMRRLDSGSGGNNTELEKSLLTNLFSQSTVLFSRFLWLDSERAITENLGSKEAPVLLTDSYFTLLDCLFSPQFDAPLWRSLPDNVRAPEFVRCCAQTFLDARGADNLARALGTLLEHLHDFSSLGHNLRLGSAIMCSLGQMQLRFSNTDRPLDTKSDKQPSLAICAYKTFEAVSAVLYASVEKSDLSLHTTVTRDLASELSLMPPIIARLNAQLARKLFANIISQLSVPDLFEPNLLRSAWKMKLAKRLLRKGRMELRIFGIELLSSELLEIYGRYQHNSSANLDFVARLLIDERILDYIVGLDSHPQLISMSGNVVGFLAATHNYTSDHTDLIWATIIGHQDPRVVAATVAMLTYVVQFLDVPHLLDICSKLHETPLPKFTAEFKRLTDSASGKVLLAGDQHSLTTTTMSAFTIGLHIMRQSQKIQESQANDLLRFGYELFVRAYPQLKPVEMRQDVLRSCVEDIKAGSHGATGSALALCSATQCFPEDMGYLTEVLMAPTVLVEGLCTTIEDRGSNPPDSRFAARLRNYLQLLRCLLLCKPDLFPAEQDSVIWDHLVGSSSGSKHVRDSSWECLRLLVEQCLAVNAFIERGLERQLPRLHPSSFTPISYHFLDAAVKYQSKFHPPEFSEVSDTVPIPLSEQLWTCILTVPPNTIENNTISLLVNQYTLPDLVEGPLKSILEYTHVAVAQKCVDELELTSKKLELGVEEHSHQEATDTDAAREERELARLRFSRTLRFLTLMLTSIRSNGTLSPSEMKSSPKFKKLESIEATSEPLTIKYQTFDGNLQSDLRCFTVSDQDRIGDVLQRIGELSGFSSYKIISGGQQLDLGKDHSTTVGQSGFANRGLFLIVKRVDGEGRSNTPIAAVGGSAFERELIRHYDDLYDLMKGDDPLSYEAFDFLSLFKPQSKVLDLLTSESTSVTEMFPPNRPGKIIYALQSLKSYLHDRRQDNSISAELVFRSVRHLEAAFERDIIQIPGNPSFRQLQLTSSAVECFQILLQSLPGDFAGQDLLSKPAAICNRLQDVLSNTLVTDDSRRADTSALILQSYNLMLRLSMCSEEFWNTFITQDRFVDLHRRLLLNEKEPFIREKACVTIRNVFESRISTAYLTDARVAAGFLPLLKALVPVASQSTRTSRPFFDVACMIFNVNRKYDHLSSQTLLLYYYEWSRLLRSFCGTRKTQYVGQEFPDDGVFGVVVLLSACVQAMNASGISADYLSIVREIFPHFVFPSSTESSSTQGAASSLIPQIRIPIQDDSTRFRFYDLFNHLCTDVPILQSIITTILDALDTSQFNLLEFCALGSNPVLGNTTESPGISGSWQIDRFNHIRSPTGYVGISNLSNTCYMNSLLSQLFMNPGFRHFILSANIVSPPDQPLIIEAQKLFANMQESYDKYASTSGFAKSLRLDDQEIDVTVQMDVDEFFAHLFDSWESQLLSSSDKDMFRRFYGGTNVTQIRPTDCAHVSEKIENFYVVQLEVKSKTTLEDSLKAYVEGDVLEGENKYQCTQCEGGRYAESAVTRTCLKEVPDNLILHLKRFDYDLVTLTRHKVNDQFEFPSRIDMSHYKLENLTNPEAPKEEDIFELVGILVHSGSAEMGHYYSYIRERQRPTWVQFNDTNVSSFDPREIGSNCFGGPLSQTNRDNKHWSAYMLFYERASNVTAQSHQDLENFNGSPLKVPIPLHLRPQIASENQRRIIRHCLFDDTFPQFVTALLGHVQEFTTQLRGSSIGASERDIALQRMTMDLLFKALDRVIARTKDTPQIDTFLDTMMEWLLSSTELMRDALEYLGAHPEIVIDLIARCPLSKNRIFVRQHLQNLLSQLKKRAPRLYGLEGTNQLMTVTDAHIRQDAAVAVFCNGLKEQLPKLPTTNRAWDETFYFLLAMARGDQEAIMLLKTGFLEDCLSIILCDENFESMDKFENVNSLLLRKNRLPPFRLVIELVYRLFCFIDFEVGVADDLAARYLQYNEVTKSLPLTRREHELLTHSRAKTGLTWLNRMLEWYDPHSDFPVQVGLENRPHYIPSAVVELLQSEANANLELADEIFKTLLQGVRNSSAAALQPYVMTSTVFCHGRLSEQQARDLIHSVAVSTKRLGEHSGDYHVAFFDQVSKINNEGVEVGTQAPELRTSTGHENDATADGTFLIYVLENAQIWGPHLLEHDADLDTRRNTVTLLTTLLFEYPPVCDAIRDSPQDTTQEDSERMDSGTTADHTAGSTSIARPMRASPIDNARAIAIRWLMFNCQKRCQYAYDQQTNKRFMLPVLEILDQCGTWLQKLQKAKGDASDELQARDGIQVRASNNWVFYDDDYLIVQWRRFVRNTNDWQEEEMVELTEGDDEYEDESEWIGDEA